MHARSVGPWLFASKLADVVARPSLVGQGRNAGRHRNHSNHRHRSHRNNRTPSTAMQPSLPVDAALFPASLLGLLTVCPDVLPSCETRLAHRSPDHHHARRSTDRLHGDSDCDEDEVRFSHRRGLSSSFFDGDALSGRQAPLFEGELDS